MVTIYILECEDGHYYVGKTTRLVENRVDEHFAKCGSEWTMKYKPVKIVEVINNADDFDEDKYTKIYMKKYGIDRVRGGAYSQIVLPDFSVRALEYELRGAADQCFRCKRTGHFASNCYARTTSDGITINDGITIIDTHVDVYCCDYCGKEFETEKEATRHETKCSNLATNAINMGVRFLEALAGDKDLVICGCEA